MFRYRIGSARIMSEEIEIERVYVNPLDDKNYREKKLIELLERIADALEKTP